MKQPLHVLVSHSGKTVELDVGAHARVGAVQQTLADLTGIPVGEQILMCEGARLDGAKPLAAYGLPGEDAGKVQDLFLYSRAHLRPSAVLPPAEALPPLEPDLSGVEAIRTQRHRLDAASSPLLRALPDYLQQFQEHLLTAAARHDACQHRLVTCARLLGEQEVQALSTDAATSNVELHYAYICDAYGAFMARYRQQAAAHADVLSRFESDLAYLAATDLHPALRISASAVSGSTAGAGSAASSAASGSSGAASQQAMQPAMASLLHLLNAGALRESAAGAARGHTHFGSKVSELEGLFGALKADVEALFMQAPSVDLEALARELEEMHGQVDEQASIVAALSSDLNKVQQLVEQASEQVASDPAASVQVTDTVHMLETMHETHVGHLLPRVTACHAAVEAFAARCLDCKNALTRDVFSQLHTISSQQSKIREMKNKLALFREALARQEGSVQELLVVRRVPAAYKQCLAECVRREAFMEKYAHSAAALAERMGVFREKELAMRDSFRKHVERLIPPSLLERMGLLEQPPHCQVSVSATEGERLLAVTLDDVRRIQLPWGAAQQQRAAQQQQQQPGTPTASDAEAAEQQQHGEGAAETDVTASLQLENAKLRAELASAIALDCIRAAQLATVGGMGGAAALTPRPCSGQASPLAASTASSPRGSTVVTAAGAAGGGGGAPLPADAAQRFERALSAKDGLVSELQAQLGASRQQAAAYEARIQALETQLTQVAAAADGRGGSAQPPLSVGSGMQQPPAPSSAPGSLMSRSGAAAGATSGSSATATSLPAAPGSAVQREPALDLAASIDAAAGSSLSGMLHAPDVARSLGASTSQAGSQQQQQQPHGHPQEHAPSPAASPTAAAAVAASAPAPAAAAADVGSTLPGSPAASGGMQAAAVDAASRAPLGPPLADSTCSDAAPPPAGESGAEGAAALQPDEAAAALAASAADAAALQAEAEGEPAAQAAEPAPAAEAPQAWAAPPGPAAPPSAPHPLLSLIAALADEGSDVEGVEPVTDSEEEEEEDGRSSRGGGYGSAHSGEGPASAQGDGAPPAGTAAAEAAAAQHEEEEQE